MSLFTIFNMRFAQFTAVLCAIAGNCSSVIKAYYDASFINGTGVRGVGLILALSRPSGASGFAVTWHAWTTFAIATSRHLKAALRCPCATPLMSTLPTPSFRPTPITPTSCTLEKLGEQYVWRTILAQFERNDGASISALARPFAIKLPAVMKHLDAQIGDFRGAA